MHITAKEGPFGAHQPDPASTPWESVVEKATASKNPDAIVTATVIKKEGKDQTTVCLSKGGLAYSFRWLFGHKEGDKNQKTRENLMESWVAASLLPKGLQHVKGIENLVRAAGHAIFMGSKKRDKLTANEIKQIDPISANAAQHFKRHEWNLKLSQLQQAAEGASELGISLGNSERNDISSKLFVKLFENWLSEQDKDVVEDSEKLQNAFDKKFLPLKKKLIDFLLKTEKSNPDLWSNLARTNLDATTTKGLFENIRIAASKPKKTQRE